MQMSAPFLNSHNYLFLTEGDKSDCNAIARKIAPSTSAQFYFESIIDSSSTNQMGIERARLARQAYCSYCIRETLISIPIPK